MTTPMPRAPRIVMASGVFDLLHVGHVSLLFRAKQLGDVLVVGVLTDAGTEAYKYRRPVDSEADRLAAVRALGCVDVAVLQEETDPTPLLERFRPDVLVHGDDWVELRAGQETVARLGIEWVLLPYTQGVSSSMLREVGA